MSVKLLIVLTISLLSFNALVLGVFQEILTDIGAERHRGESMAREIHSRRITCRVSLKVRLVFDPYKLRTLCLYKAKKPDDLFESSSYLSLDGLNLPIDDIYNQVQPVGGFVLSEPNSAVQGYIIKNKFYGTVRMFDKYRLYHIVFYVEPTSSLQLYSPDSIIKETKSSNAFLFEYVSTVPGSQWVSCSPVSSENGQGEHTDDADFSEEISIEVTTVKVETEAIKPETLVPSTTISNPTTTVAAITIVETTTVVTLATTEATTVATLATTESTTATSPIISTRFFNNGSNETSYSPTSIVISNVFSTEVTPPGITLISPINPEQLLHSTEAYGRNLDNFGYNYQDNYEDEVRQFTFPPFQKPVLNSQKHRKRKQRNGTTIHVEASRETEMTLEGAILSTQRSIIGPHHSTSVTISEEEDYQSESESTRLTTVNVENEAETDLDIIKWSLSTDGVANFTRNDLETEEMEEGITVEFKASTEFQRWVKSSKTMGLPLPSNFVPSTEGSFLKTISQDSEEHSIGYYLSTDRAESEGGISRATVKNRRTTPAKASYPPGFHPSTEVMPAITSPVLLHSTERVRTTTVSSTIPTSGTPSVSSTLPTNPDTPLPTTNKSGVDRTKVSVTKAGKTPVSETSLVVTELPKTSVKVIVVSNTTAAGVTTLLNTIQESVISSKKTTEVTTAPQTTTKVFEGTNTTLEVTKEKTTTRTTKDPSTVLKSSGTPTIEPKPTPDQGSDSSIINTSHVIKTTETKTTNNVPQEVITDGVIKYFAADSNFSQGRITLANILHSTLPQTDLVHSTLGYTGEHVQMDRTSNQNPIPLEVTDTEATTLFDRTKMAPFHSTDLKMPFHYTVVSYSQRVFPVGETNQRFVSQGTSTSFNSPPPIVTNSSISSTTTREPKIPSSLIHSTESIRLDHSTEPPSYVVPDVDVIPAVNLVPDTKPESDANLVPDTKPESDANLVPDTKPESDANLVPDTKPESDANLDPAVKIVPDANVDPAIQFVPDAIVEPVVKLVTDTSAAPYIDDHLGNETRKRKRSINLNHFFGENLLLKDEDVEETVDFISGKSNSDVFDLRRSSGLTCSLCLWIQPHFAESFGLSGGMLTGVAEVLDMVRFINWIFRGIDFNQDGYPENIGFIVSKVLLTDEVSVQKESPVRKKRWTYNKRDYIEEGPGDSLAQLMERIEELGGDEISYEQRRFGRKTDFEDLSDYYDPDKMTDEHEIPKLTRMEAQAKLNDFSRDIKSLPATLALDILEPQLLEKLSGCCAILGFIYHDLTPAFATTTQRGLCSGKNVGLISGMLNKQKIGKYDVIRGIMHTLGHLFGAAHDNPAVAECADENLYPFLNPFPLHPVHQLNVGLRPNSHMFSSCAVDHITVFLASNGASCLNQNEDFFCGNGILEYGEECDCGSPTECSLNYHCCGDRDSLRKCRITVGNQKRCLRLRN